MAWIWGCQSHLLRGAWIGWLRDGSHTPGQAGAEPRGRQQSQAGGASLLHLVALPDPRQRPVSEGRLAALGITEAVWGSGLSPQDPMTKVTSVL